MSSNSINRWIGVTLTTILVGAYALHIRPGGSGVLAAFRLPDGCEYVVTQHCNWIPGEPYTVDFYMRAPGNGWGWCYIDHQASRWNDTRITYDDKSDKVLVTENGVPQAVLDRKRNMFWIPTSLGGREVAAPQDYREPRYKISSP